MVKLGMSDFEDKDDFEEDLEVEERRKIRTSPRWKRRKLGLKEPVKPWTKSERYLVLSVLLATVLVSSFLAFSARSWKLPGLPRINLPCCGVISDLWKKETIILEKDKTDSKIKGRREFLENKSKNIIASFRGETKRFSGVYGFYFVDIESGFSFGVNEREIFDGASLVKLPVMVALSYLEENGNLSFDEKYVLKNSDKASGAGVLTNKPAGTEVTYGEILELMGKRSDNTAFVIAKAKVGKELIDKIMTKAGMQDTNIDSREMTPFDVGMFFLNLWKGELVGDKNKEKILDALTNTDFENYLPKGLPESVRIAHKFGTLTHIINDAGVVYAEKPYILVLMSKGVVEKEANAFIPTFSKLVYEEVASAN